MATFPMLHLNGTGKNDLRDEYAAAYDAIGKAVEALAATTCNGRDFPKGWDDYYKARDERTEAFTKLREAHAYVGAILMGICDQM